MIKTHQLSQKLIKPMWSAHAECHSVKTFFEYPDLDSMGIIIYRLISLKWIYPKIISFWEIWLANREISFDISKTIKMLKLGKLGSFLQN